MVGFTERQQFLIDACVKSGFGWAKYAQSVQSQGYCSAGQEATLVSMFQRIQSKTPKRERHDASYDCDISDNEAFGLGEYF